MSTLKTTNVQHPSAASPAIVLDSAGGATVAGMGLVLVSPTSIANSGGSASASGGAVTFTGVSSISLNNCFSATYSNYRLLITNTSVSVDGAINRFRLRANGSDASGNIYFHSTSRSNWTGSFAFYTAGNPSDMVYLSENDNTAGSQMSIDIHSPFSTAYAAMMMHSVRPDIGMEIGGAHIGVTTSYDGFTIYPSTGNFTGTIRVYGYKNS